MPAAGEAGLAVYWLENGFAGYPSDYFSNCIRFADRYSRMDESGKIVPDPERQEMVRRKLTVLRRPFADNNLLTVEAFDKQDNLIDREYRLNDFAVGLMLCAKANKVRSWTPQVRKRTRRTCRDLKSAG